MIRFCRLTVEGYGRFRSAHTFEFQHGLNLILGANESGKSTLLSALLDALYANPNSTAQSVRQRIHWGHPDGWRLELTLDYDGERIKLTKFHPNDDPRKRGEFILERDGQLFKGDSAQREWDALWKMAREVYEATACIRQREMASLANQRTLSTLQQQLRESAVATDLEPIFRQIDARRREIQKRISEAEARIEQIQKALHSARTTEAQARTYRQQLEQYRQRLDQLHVEIAEKDALLQRWQSVRLLSEELSAKRKEANQLAEQIETLMRTQTDLERLDEELQRDYAELSALPSDFFHSLQAEYKRYQRARQEESQARNQLDSLRLESQQEIGQSRARKGLVLMGIAIGVAGALFLNKSQALGMGLIGLGVLVVLIGLLWRPRGHAELQARRALLEERYQSARAERKTLEAELVNRLRSAGITEVQLPSPERNGSEYDLSTPIATALARFEERWRRFQQLQTEYQRLSAVYSALLRTRSLEQTKARYRELGVEIVGLSQKLENDPVHRDLATRPAEEFLRLQEQLAQLRQEFEQTQRDYHRTEGLLQSALHHDDPEALELQRQSAQAELDYLSNRLETLQNARALLEEANRIYLSNLSPLLKPRIEGYLPQLTGGRYQQVAIESDLSLKVFHIERGEPIALSENDPAWSAGTLDQLFFACRLGLSDALSGDVRVPLLLDEPFVYSDTVRLQSALELLRSVATQTQVLYFTCRSVSVANAHRIELG